MSEEIIIKNVCPECGSENIGSLFVINKSYTKAGRFRKYCKSCGWCPYLGKKWTAEEHKQWDRIGIGLTILGVILLMVSYGYEEAVGDIASLLKIFGFIFIIIGIFIWKAPYTF